MPAPWTTLDHFDCDEGRMELRQRAERDFLITVGGRVLMTSTAQDSELKLAQWGCGHLADQPQPRVLIGGLGMAYTLRAALDALGSDAIVHVAELHAQIMNWCKGPLAPLTQNAASDPRVQLFHTDVMAHIRSASCRYDAIVWDLYEGPHHAKDQDPLYGTSALRAVLDTLSPRGVFSVWSEQADQSFEKRLDRMRSSWKKNLAGRGGRRHPVYLIQPAAGPPKRRPNTSKS